MARFTPRAGLFALVLLTLAAPVFAQSPQEVRRNLIALRSDKIPDNCSNAVSWLGQYREKLKDELLTELYKTDRQGRDAICSILFRTKSFTPDERFFRYLLSRAEERDTYVHSGDIMPPEEFDREFDRMLGASWRPTHWEEWLFFDRHFDQVEPLLGANLARAGHVQVLWQTAWLFKKRGVLEKHLDEFTPEVLSLAARHLANDSQAYNASQAVRLFLLLGDHAQKTLAEAAQSRDPQAADLARATADALKGSRKAFGFLNAKVGLVASLFGESRPEPEWLDAATEPYLDKRARYRP